MQSGRAEWPPVPPATLGGKHTMQAHDLGMATKPSGTRQAPTAAPGHPFQPAQPEGVGPSGQARGHPSTHAAGVFCGDPQEGPLKVTFRDGRRPDAQLASLLRFVFGVPQGPVKNGCIASADKAGFRICDPSSDQLLGVHVSCKGRLHRHPILLLLIGTAPTSCAFNHGSEPGTAASTSPQATCTRFLQPAPCSACITIAGTANGVELPWAASGGHNHGKHARSRKTQLDKRLRQFHF